MLVAGIGIAIGVAGCTSSVSASDIAQQAKTTFNKQFAAQGQSKRIASVKCPNDLDAKVGASEVCSGIGTPGNVHLNIRATVNSVHGSTAHLHYSLSVASGASAPSSQSGTSTG